MFNCQLIPGLPGYNCIKFFRNSYAIFFTLIKAIGFGTKTSNTKMLTA